MNDNLDKLVRASMAGDKRAFARLVSRFQKRIFYTVLKVVRDVHTADDLTQEVFVKAFCNLNKLKTPSYFGTWIHRIALNKAIDSHRRTKKEGENIFFVEDFYETGQAGKGGEHGQRSDLELLREKLKEAVDALPEGQRNVLLMTMDKGMPQEQIAAVLEIPVGTVKSRLFHARKFLAVRLKDYM